MLYTKKRKEEPPRSKPSEKKKKEILRNKIMETDRQKKKKTQQTLSKKHSAFMNIYVRMKCVLMCMCDLCMHVLLWRPGENVRSPAPSLPTWLTSDRVSHWTRKLEQSSCLCSLEPWITGSLRTIARILLGLWKFELTSPGLHECFFLSHLLSPWNIIFYCFVSKTQQNLKKKSLSRLREKM